MASYDESLAGATQNFANCTSAKKVGIFYLYILLVILGKTTCSFDFKKISKNVNFSRFRQLHNKRAVKNRKSCDFRIFTALFNTRKVFKMNGSSLKS